MRRKILIISAVCIWNHTSAQKTIDTIGLLNEFSKVMSFTTQPFVYYSTNTKISSEPVMDSKDTAFVTSEFYKNGTELYSTNSVEEVYLQDSLMIEINKERKSILIRKVDIATKKNLNLLPLNSAELMEKFRQSYSISKLKLSQDVSRLEFEGRKSEYSNSSTTTLITLDYSEKTFLPSSIEVNVELKQPADQQILEAIRSEGINESQIVKNIEGVKYVFRKQVMRIDFVSISNDSEKVSRIPSYHDNLVFNANSGEFVGKGQYKDFEITTTF